MSVATRDRIIEVPPGPRREAADERLARARAALGAAERSASRWGGRIDRTALRPAGGLGGPTGLVPSPPRTHEGPSPAEREAAEADPLDAHARRPVPEPLAPLVPHGTLRAGSSLAVTGCASTSLLLALAASAAGEDAWCAIAGMPHLGLRSALDAGLDPCRLAIVPDAAEQTAQVLSALIDGVGIVVLGPELPLTPVLWRTLTGRARTRDALVLAAAPPGRADLHLRAASIGWDGLGRGSGRLRRRRLALTAEGRGIAGHREVEVLLPEVRGLVGAVPAARAAASASAPAALRAIRRAG